MDLDIFFVARRVKEPGSKMEPVLQKMKEKILRLAQDNKINLWLLNY